MSSGEAGTVYLVGAGPGDLGLLTLRGKELLETADVVVYDYLSNDSLLRFCGKDAELIDVGKRPGRPVPQSEINEVLIQSAKSAAVVVRLKGGDPFVFGRGGEEALALREAGISFEIVPGVSSAVAVPAYAGVPVTHRGLATSFTVVTGHRHGEATDQVDWASLARLGGTIVVLMGVAHRGEIAQKLMDGGLPGNTPVAAIRWGTTGGQTSLRTTLERLEKTPVFSPSTIVIGAVAGLNLRWFERKPLLGRRVVVTRTKAQASVLSNRLVELGATVLEVPTIEIQEPSDNYLALRSAVAEIANYEWIIFTSPNAVPVFFAHLRDARDLAGVKVAAIGPGTAKEISKFNVVADFVPSEYVGETLVREFPFGQGRILLPRAKVARDVIPLELVKKGWKVDIVEVYKTGQPEMDSALATEISACDAITFTSSSTVSNFMDVFGVDSLPANIIAIGPVTQVTLSNFGVYNVKVASNHDIEGLIQAILEVFPQHSNAVKSS